MSKKTMDHTELLVLSLLSGEDMYGYQIITELARRSDNTFEMKEGTLYPVLHSLLNKGAVECCEREAPTGRRRKYYHINKRGLEELKEETEQWKSYSRGIEAVLSFAPAMG